MITVTTADGQMLTVEVPDGVAAGHEFEISFCTPTPVLPMAGKFC